MNYEFKKDRNPVLLVYFTFGTWYSSFPPRSNFTFSGGVYSSSGLFMCLTMEAKNAA